MFRPTLEFTELEGRTTPAVFKLSGVTAGLKAAVQTASTVPPSDPMDNPPPVTTTGTGTGTSTGTGGTGTSGGTTTTTTTPLVPPPPAPAPTPSYSPPKA